MAIAIKEGISPNAPVAIIIPINAPSNKIHISAIGSILNICASIYADFFGLPLHQIVSFVERKKSIKAKQNRIGQDKGQCKFSCLPAIFNMLFGEREYSTPLSALFFKQYTSTQFANRA